MTIQPKSRSPQISSKKETAKIRNVLIKKGGCSDIDEPFNKRSKLTNTVVGSGDYLNQFSQDTFEKAK